MSRAAKIAAIEAMLLHDCASSSDEENVMTALEDGEATFSAAAGDNFTEDEEEEALDADLLVNFQSVESDDDDFLAPSTPEEVATDYTAPSGLRWTQGKASFSSQVSQMGRKNAANIFKGVPFEVKRGLHPQSERDSFLIFFDDIIDDCVIYTNLYARRYISKFNLENDSKKVWKPTDRVEIEAFFGLLILAGAFKAHHRSTVDLWSQRDGQPVFRATMSRQRFCELKSFLRFDDTLRRDKEDPLAPVRKASETFFLKLGCYVAAPEFITVDEQLLEFHGRVKFRQYIASKPGKFGIKIYWLCSSDGEYVFNGVVYIGAKSINECFINASASHGEAVVKQLIEPYLDNGRNLTVDNYFTSIHLADDLSARKTTLVGTIRRNNRCVPAVANDLSERRKGDSRYFISDGKMLCSFWDKGNKPVLLLDTFDPTAGDVQNLSEKPSTVKFYNATKSGVDIVDKKVRAYSCKRKCRRWPFSVICNFADIALINSSFIFFKVRGEVKNKRLSFLVSCGYQLLNSLIQRRLAIPRALKQDVKMAMQLCGYEVENKRDQNASFLQKARRCEICPTKADRKSKSMCNHCGKVVCVEHSAKVCFSCLGHL